MELGFLVGIEVESRVGDDVGSLAVGAGDGTNDGVAIGPSEGPEDGNICVFGGGLGIVLLYLSQVHPHSLNPISKVLEYDDVFGATKASLAAMKYSVLIPSMNDQYAVLLPMSLLTSTCSYFFLPLPDVELTQFSKRTPQECVSGVLQLV